MTHELTLKVGSPHLLRDHLRRAAEMAGLGTNVWNTLTDAAEQIEKQVKPAIEEPKEFGSIVRAISGPSVYGTLWQMAPGHGEHYWQDAHGCVEVWSELTDVEVLRVGLGPEPLAERDPLNEQEVRDVATAVLSAMDVDQYLIDAVANARPR